MILSSDDLLNEIRELHECRQSGLLALENAGGERIDVFLREGMIEAVSSNSPNRRLGCYLAQHASLPSRDLDALESEARRQNILFGEAVVRKNLADRNQVRKAVRQQSMESLHAALDGNFSVSSFTSELRSYYVPARISFPNLVLELAREKPAPVELQAGTQVVLSPGIDASVYEWRPEELCVLIELQYPNTFQALLDTTGFDAPVLKRILGVFHRLEIIDITNASEAHFLEAADSRLSPNTNALVRRGDFPFEDLIPLASDSVLDEKLEIARSGFSFTSEQFKNLKVQLGELSSQHSLKVLTVSSPGPGEGKSLVSATLAFCYAIDPGRRIVIVDCDLRRPSLDKYLGVSSEPGLLQCLTDSRLRPYCYLRRVEGLYFLTAGGVADNPIEILSMRRMKQLMEILRTDFDTIILDAPPYSPISDARVVTGLSDGLIMVVREGKTSYSAADRTFKVIDRNKLLGVVFNGVRPMPFQAKNDFAYNPSLYSNHDKNTDRSKKYLRA